MGRVGGGAVRPPAREGFASHLIRRTLNYELQGKVENQFDAEGFHCTLRIPLGPGVEANPAEPGPLAGGAPSEPPRLPQSAPRPLVRRCWWSRTTGWLR